MLRAMGTSQGTVCAEPPRLGSWDPSPCLVPVPALLHVTGARAVRLYSNNLFPFITRQYTNNMCISQRSRCACALKESEAMADARSQHATSHLGLDGSDPPDHAIRTTRLEEFLAAVSPSVPSALRSQRTWRCLPPCLLRPCRGAARGSHPRHYDGRLRACAVPTSAVPSCGAARQRGSLHNTARAATTHTHAHPGDGCDRRSPEACWVKREPQVNGGV